MIRQRKEVLRYGLHRRRPRRRPQQIPTPPQNQQDSDGPQQLIPDSTLISRMAELMAELSLIREHILPYRRSLDIGTDIITHYGDVLKRVQVKGQASKGRGEHTFTFSTCRNELGVKRPYRPNEIDAFIFVHTEAERFFVMPADQIIASKRCTITFSPTSHPDWEDAWWILKKRKIA